jgi:hypothetical protein
VTVSEKVRRKDKRISRSQFKKLSKVQKKLYLSKLNKLEIVKKEVMVPGKVNYDFPENLGRLAVVTNVSGKSRIVGMTNYWIQIALYPVHKSIFTFLKTLSTDGTFDQHTPVKRMIEDQKGFNRLFYSFDLSAATDRLPLPLQEQVLASFTDARLARL